MRDEALVEARVVIVTGANDGIGFHLAKALASEGYQVAALDKENSRLETLAEEQPERVLPLRCDVTSDGDVRAAVEATIRRWGRIDVLVNNAAVAVFRRFDERSREETRREFEVNYFGYVRLIEAVLPQFKAEGRGIIHNMSSGVGVTGFPGLSGYTSTKGAIEALTRTLALEFARYGIAVTTMHPPLTATTSASPLGLPREVLADPADVGRRLARRIRSTRPVIAADFRTAVYLWVSQRHPRFIGRLFARLGGLM